MPKQRKRDGLYWRKDRKQWWVSYVDAQGSGSASPRRMPRTMRKPKPTAKTNGARCANSAT